MTQKLRHIIRSTKSLGKFLLNPLLQLLLIAQFFTLPQAFQGSVSFLVLIGRTHHSFQVSINRAALLAVRLQRLAQ